MKMSVDQALRKARSLSPDEAEALYREVLSRFPCNKRVLAALESLRAPAPRQGPSSTELNMAITLYGQGQLAQAQEMLDGLLQRYPGSEVLHNTAGAVAEGMGQLDSALAHYDKAIALAPDYFEACNNRGVALQAHGRHAEALACFDQALAINPAYTKALVNRGLALGKLMRLEEALTCFNQAIRRDPALAEAFNNKGNILLALNRAGEALPCFEKAIGLKGNLASAHVNRGNALIALKQWEDALGAYDRAILLAPADAMAFRNRGAALRKLRRLDEALASYRRAAQLQPESVRDLAEVRDLEAHLCLWNEAPDLPQGDAVPPFYMLHFTDDPQRQLACATAWTAELCGAITADPITPRPAEDRIRIGYFSADFHNHATMYLMARLFELHDKARFEIHAFSYGPDVQDEMRSRLVTAVDAFHQVGDRDDQAIARLARDKGIDIAIDLKGHTENARIGIFAHRAAPVQAQYLGYPGTMGATFMDYVIADAITVPPEAEGDYVEKVARLPHSYQVNDDARAISGRTFVRAELGLPEDGFVFCCFNNNYKIAAPEFDIWMRLLAQVPGSVLWLIEDNAWAAANLRSEAERRGIASDRLVFAPRMPLAEHLARHRCADLFLDTFHYNAHTTASDALWAGLPVMTKLGRSFASRVAGSLLHAVGLPELVTDTAQAYEALALRLATDPAALAAIRTKLAANLPTSPLFDTSRFARNIEALYENLHARAAGDC